MLFEWIFLYSGLHSCDEKAAIVSVIVPSINIFFSLILSFSSLNILRRGVDVFVAMPLGFVQLLGFVN